MLKLTGYGWVEVAFRESKRSVEASYVTDAPRDILNAFCDMLSGKNVAVVQLDLESSGPFYYIFVNENGKFRVIEDFWANEKDRFAIYQFDLIENAKDFVRDIEEDHANWERQGGWAPTEQELERLKKLIAKPTFAVKQEDAIRQEDLIKLIAGEKLDKVEDAFIDAITKAVGRYTSVAKVQLKNGIGYYVFNYLDTTLYQINKNGKVSAKAMGFEAMDIARVLVENEYLSDKLSELKKLIENRRSNKEDLVAYNTPGTKEYEETRNFIKSISFDEIDSDTFIKPEVWEHISGAHVNRDLPQYYYVAYNAVGFPVRSCEEEGKLWESIRTDKKLKKKMSVVEYNDEIDGKCFSVDIGDIQLYFIVYKDENGKSFYEIAPAYVNENHSYKIIKRAENKTTCVDFEISVNDKNCYLPSQDALGFTEELNNLLGNFSISCFATSISKTDKKETFARGASNGYHANFVGTVQKIKKEKNVYTKKPFYAIDVKCFDLNIKVLMNAEVLKKLDFKKGDTVACAGFMQASLYNAYKRFSANLTVLGGKKYFIIRNFNENSVKYYPKSNPNDVVNINFDDIVKVDINAVTSAILVGANWQCGVVIKLKSGKTLRFFSEKPTEYMKLFFREYK